MSTEQSKEDILQTEDSSKKNLPIFDSIQAIVGNLKKSTDPEIENASFSQEPISPNPRIRSFKELSLDSELALELRDLSQDEENKEAELEKAATYTKLIVENDKLIHGISKTYATTASIILEMVNLRNKYVLPISEYSRVNELIEFKPPSSEPIVNYLKDTHVFEKLSEVKITNTNGVWIPEKNGEPICAITSPKQYISDINFLLNENYKQTTKAFCNKRLDLLSEKFNMHLLFNREKEFFEQKMNIHRDFYNLRKADNLLDHAAAPNVNLYLAFVKKKAVTEWKTEVTLDHLTGLPLTLDKVLEMYGLKSSVITIEDLEVRSYFQDSYPRYGLLPSSHKPSKKSVLGEIFLQWDNLIKGRFLAELTHELFKEFKSYKFQVSELRISIFGKDMEEWKRLATWFNTYKIFDQRIRWFIRVPRLYDIYRKEGMVNNFQEVLDNLFKPLFEVTLDPSSNPELHRVLFTVIGFDPVDVQFGFHKSSNPSLFKILPSEWTSEENPDYCYWIYYLWANIQALNHLRKSRGLNTFAFRPQMSEISTIEHLISSYLLAHGIGRGSRVRKSPLLQYLFYIKQIGITMSPLTENKQDVKYHENPFPVLFARGLNVSLSTDHPLLYHMTSQPLIEEYSISSQVFDLSSSDLCELARNSVLQCGFEDIIKKYWIGENYKLMEPEGNDYEKTNVPYARYLYRIETLASELRELKSMSQQNISFEQSFTQ